MYAVIDSCAMLLLSNSRAPAAVRKMRKWIQDSLSAVTGYLVRGGKLLFTSVDVRFAAYIRSEQRWSAANGNVPTELPRPLQKPLALPPSTVLLREPYQPHTCFERMEISGVPISSPVLSDTTSLPACYLNSFLPTFLLTSTSYPGFPPVFSTYFLPHFPP